MLIDRAYDLADSRGLRSFAWICVVLKARAGVYSSIDQIMVDEKLLASINESDESLVRAENFKSPAFTTLKR